MVRGPRAEGGVTAANQEPGVDADFGIAQTSFARPPWASWAIQVHLFVHFLQLNRPVEPASTARPCQSPTIAPQSPTAASPAIFLSSGRRAGVSTGPHPVTEVDELDQAIIQHISFLSCPPWLSIVGRCSLDPQLRGRPHSRVWGWGSLCFESPHSTAFTPPCLLCGVRAVCRPFTSRMTHPLMSFCPSLLAPSIVTMSVL